MTVYPFGIDSDQTIIRVDDNLTEIGGDSINQLRDAVFAIEKELGISPSGSAGSLSNRFNVAHNADGSIKASALASVGLATLPIVDNQVASNAGIKEYKLALDFSTSDLNTLITTNAVLLTSLTAFANTVFSDLNLHLAGAALFTDGSTSARHVLSQIDINAVPNDSRDPAYVWTGLKNKNGVLRPATQAMDALLEVNNGLVDHENATSDAHVASAISVNTDGFNEIPTTATTAQKIFNYLDNAEVLNMGEHRATEHANSIPRVARSQSPILPDGYSSNVIPPTEVFTYLTHSPSTGPVDDLSVGDDIIKFIPSDTNFVFDAQFSQIKFGDILRVNYGNGIEATFAVESIRFIPGAEWIIRVDGVNLFESTDGTASARIDRADYDVNTVGVLAVASANASSAGNPGSFSNILQSVIVGSPRGATVYGLGFDAGQLNSAHYNLYLEMYPTGNPVDHVIALPPIDVTGDEGASPGSYSLNNVVENINNTFRSIGYNYRFIAFAHKGEIGIMLADAINNVSFAIISGSNSSGTLKTGIYANNVIGGNSVDDFDALGFGTLGANLASPAYQGTWADTTAALLPTKIILPLQKRNFIANGQRNDTFEPTYLANADGYWDGYISARTPVGTFTVEVTYTIALDLAPARLKAGKTIVIQPAIPFSNSLYSDVDYGRFIIKSVAFISPCPPFPGYTEITVINGIHGTGNGFGFSSAPNLPVQIYFSDDSVGFDIEEVIDQSPTPNEYHRLHEIYVNQNGKTFSHERARLPRQTEDPNKLSTDNLHISSVSSKLRGYAGADPLVFNKFVRFYVLSYNSTSGEYDGYLGQIAGTNGILKTGERITGRKNVVTRFYDETNIDYVDLIFQELAVFPGVDILSTASPRYVDIELFPSLQLDDRLFLLATCEVNWSPASGQFVVQNVNDERQFGSVDETDFTDSAIDFINAGDKYLHANGVIRGLGLNNISSIPNSGEIFFNGGVALVNGAIATVNNMSVTIPQISDSTLGLPQDLTWAICVNEYNNLVPILLTSSKEQFFATPSSGNYYIQSVSFNELINTRQDLTPIALATAHIASLTITNVTDIRKFVLTEGLNNYLTWTDSNKVVGHFHNFAAVQQWVQNSSSGNNNIQVKGIFNISSFIDMSNFSRNVTFDGTGATFNVTSPKGIVLGSNVTFKNFTFTYNPTGISYNDSDYINTGHGCLYVDLQSSVTTVSNLTIDNCSFSTTISGSQRPPFIGMELIKGSVINNLVITSCQFSDQLNSQDQAAIAIINLNSGGNSNPATVVNSIIRDNYCDRSQGIYVTSVSSFVPDAPFTNEEFDRPGLNSKNVNIENNTSGCIGYLISGASNSSLVDGYGSTGGLSISKNTCNLIGGMNSAGILSGWSSFGLTVNYGTGSVLIDGNKTRWIQTIAQESTSNNERGALAISNNFVTSFDTGYLSSRYQSSTNAGIAVTGSFDLGTGRDIANTELIISNNTVKSVLGSFNYNSPILTFQAANIIGNNIYGIASGGNGIAIFPAPGGNIDSFSITNNKIRREGNSINGYVSNIGSTSASDSRGIIKDNIFDKNTVDGSSTNSIPNFPINWIIKENIGQTITKTISPYLGNWMRGGLARTDGSLIGPPSSSPSSTASIILAEDSGVSGKPRSHIEWNDHSTESGGEQFNWGIPLDGLIPYGATITDIHVYNIFIDTATSTILTITCNGSGSYVASATFTINMTPANWFLSPNLIMDSSSFPSQATISIDVSGINCNVLFDNVTITYRW